MTNGNGVSRGDRNRNARLARLRELVPLDNAIVGIDLADKKQMVVVTDHDSKVLARRTFRCRAWDLGVALDWAADRAAAKGFAGVTVSCEPTGHRWRVLGQLAADRSMPFVCVQPMQTSWARRSEDLTFDKTDDKDAVLIARLTAQLRCYVPEPVDETWGRLRHLGARREQLIVDDGRPDPADPRPARVRVAGRAGDRPAAVPVQDLGRGDERWSWTATAATWTAPDGWAGPGSSSAVRREITKRGGQKPCLRIVRNLFAALADPAGVLAHRPRRAGAGALLLEDWADDPAAGWPRPNAGWSRCSTSSSSPSWSPRSTGSSAVGAAAILAETGDPHRFATARALVKHAGLAPREKLSGTFTGRTKLTGQGRPRLRVAAWRAVWGALQTNTVYAARYRHLTTREHNKLTPTQAQTVIAAAILRHLHAVVTTGQAWDPDIATHGTRAQRGHRSPPDPSYEAAAPS